MKRTLRGLMRLTGLEYGCFRIYALNLACLPAAASALPTGYRLARVSQQEVAHASDPAIRDEAWYGGEDALGFGIFHGDELVALQWVWYGERYRRQRNFWPLAPGEAKSVHLVTVASERGRGLATALKRHSAAELRRLGFTRVYSRIWWSNRASIRVSELAGWKHVATVLEIRKAGRNRTWRLIRRAAGGSAAGMAAAAPAAHG